MSIKEDHKKMKFMYKYKAQANEMSKQDKILITK